MVFSIKLYRVYLIAFSLLTYKSVTMSSNLCGNLFKNYNSHSSESTASHFEKIDSIQNKKQHLKRKLQQIDDQISLIKEALSKVNENYENFNFKNKKEVDLWLSLRVPSVQNLPQSIQNHYYTLSKLNDAKEFYNKIREFDFKIESLIQLESFVQLTTKYIFDSHSEINRAEVVDLIKNRLSLSDHENSTLKNNEAYFYNSINTSLKNTTLIFGDQIVSHLYPNIFSLITFNSIHIHSNKEIYYIYYAIRILQIEHFNRNRLLQEIENLSLSERAVTLETKVKNNGIDLASVQVNGVKYFDFENEVAYSYLKIIDSLGIGFGKFIAIPSVQNRPNAFIRDVKKLIKDGLKSPDEIWSELRKKTVTLFRQVAIPNDLIPTILASGMQSNFMRSGGNSDLLTSELLKRGIYYFISKHVNETVLEKSPLISTTFFEDSILAANTTKSYSQFQNAPVHTFRLDVPIYDIIISRKNRSQIQSYEILVWNYISKVSYEKEVTYLSHDTEDLRNDLNRSQQLPNYLVEPPDYTISN